MTTITILNVQLIKGQEGAPDTRFAQILITDGVTNYILGVGGLPLNGNLQPILDANAAQLWIDAVANNFLATDADLSLADGINWFNDNPATKQLFTLSLTDLETVQINPLVDALFPSASAANRTKTKKLWMALSVVARINVLKNLGKVF